MEKFTAETILSGKFSFLSASAAKKKHQLHYQVYFIKMSYQKSVKSSQKPELIDLTQDEFVDFTQKKSDNGEIQVLHTSVRHKW